MIARDLRTVFISDVHLGCRYAQPHLLLDFLKTIRPERLYILGDFIDGWKLRNSFRWPAINSQILRQLFSMMQSGTEVFYTPGNHDQFLRGDHVRSVLQVADLKVRIADEFIFEALDGRRFILTHGDEFDTFETNAQWLSLASSYVYDPMLTMNWYLSQLRNDPRRSPYAICASVKASVKRFIRFLSDFQHRLMDHARGKGCHGVICGHIHTPDLFQHDGMTYCNTGDWVENCTALIEYHDGRLQLESHFDHGKQGIAFMPAKPTLETMAEPLIDDMEPSDEMVEHFADLATKTLAKTAR